MDPSESSSMPCQNLSLESLDQFFRLQLEKMRQRQIIEQQNLEREFLEMRSKLLEQNREPGQTNFDEIQEIDQSVENVPDSVNKAIVEDIFWPQKQQSSSDESLKDEPVKSTPKAGMKTSFKKLGTSFKHKGKENRDSQKKDDEKDRKGQKGKTIKKIFRKPSWKFSSDESKLPVGPDQDEEDVPPEIVEIETDIQKEDTQSQPSLRKRLSFRFTKSNKNDHQPASENVQNTSSDEKFDRKTRKNDEKESKEVVEKPQTSDPVKKTGKDNLTSKFKRVPSWKRSNSKQPEPQKTKIQDDLGKKTSSSSDVELESQMDSLHRSQSPKNDMDSLHRSQSPGNDVDSLHKSQSPKNDVDSVNRSQSPKNKSPKKGFEGPKKKLGKSIEQKKNKPENEKDASGGKKDFPYKNLFKGVSKNLEKTSKSDIPVKVEAEANPTDPDKHQPESHSQEKISISRRSFRELFDSKKSKSVPSKDSKLQLEETNLESPRSSNRISETSPAKSEPRSPKVKTPDSVGVPEVKRGNRNLPSDIASKLSSQRGRSARNPTLRDSKSGPPPKMAPLFKKSNNKKSGKNITTKKEIRRKITPYHNDNDRNKALFQAEKTDHDHLREIYQLTSCEIIKDPVPKDQLPEVGKYSGSMGDQTLLSNPANRQTGRRTGRFRKPLDQA